MWSSKLSNDQKRKLNRSYIVFSQYDQGGEEGEDLGQQEQGAEGAGEAGRHDGEGGLDDIILQRVYF